MTGINLVIGGLAVWRLSHALVKEKGPRDLFVRLRARLGRTQKRSGGLFDMFSCVYCISTWIGLLVAFYGVQDMFHWLGYGLAFSAIAMLLEVLFTKYSNPFPVVARPATDHKVAVSASPTPEKRNDVVSYPSASDGPMTIKTDPPLLG